MAADTPSPTNKHVAIAIDLKFAMPWHQDCYEGIMGYAERHGWRCSLDVQAVGMEGNLTRAPYTGVVGRIPTDVALRVQELGLPLVGLTRNVEANYAERFQDLPGVYIDRPAGVRMAVAHLAQSGYRRLGLMEAEGFEHKALVEIARQACIEEGLAWNEPMLYDIDFVRDSETQANALRALTQYLSNLHKPIGLLVSHPSFARQVAHGCAQLGLRVPHDIGIVTPMGERVMLTRSSPTISAVEYDYYQQGYQAAAMLDNLMDGHPNKRLQQWLAPTEVVMRDSTDVFLCDDQLVSHAMRYVAEHVHQDLTVQALADAMKVSRSTLLRRFEETTGRTPQQEINRLRIEYLKRLLAETRQPIAQVGSNCGFSTASHFTRYFKRETGQTPSAYRERVTPREQ